jgi:hypothetical protein
LRSIKVGSRYFQNRIVANGVKQAWGSFYSPQKEYFCYGVRDPDMFGLGAGHVRKGLLESGLGTRCVRCLGLTWVNLRRSDMFGSGTGYVRKELL